MSNSLKWLEAISRDVDEWCLDQTTRQRFEGMVREYMEYTRRRVDESGERRVRKARAAHERRQAPKPPFYEPNAEFQVPMSFEEMTADVSCRGLPLCEKYATLAMVHDYFCVTSEPINPWRDVDSNSENCDWALGFLAWGYQQECDATQHLTDADHLRIVGIYKDVAADLGHKARKIPAPLAKIAAPVHHTTIIRQEIHAGAPTAPQGSDRLKDIKEAGLPRVPTDAARGGRKGTRRRGKQRQTRNRRPVTDPTKDMMEVHSARSSGSSFRKIAETRRKLNKKGRSPTTVIKWYGIVDRWLKSNPRSGSVGAASLPTDNRGQHTVTADRRR